MKIHYHFLGWLAFGYMGMVDAQTICNPVLPDVADAGVTKYNGKYYLGGVGTNGDFYVSEDLVHWGKPIHVVSMDNEWTENTGAGDDQIHADDMFYQDGKFHLYWSVNYWGQDKHAVHIVHAVSDSILGPYHEPERTTWMDNRIDPHVFMDDDGRLYMYMVRFTDGNTIWAREMKNPGEFSGEPVCLFSSLPDTWERMDNKVAEGPWVMKYRGQYYMMYNANHTAPEWGNYQLGVAQADSPLSFQQGNKYSYPVVKSNQCELEENYQDVLRYGAVYAPEFAYTESVPANGWNTSDFNDSGWKRGQCGFSSETIDGSTTRKQKTVWKSGKLWLRKDFIIDEPNSNYALRVHHDGETKVYLNASLIYHKSGKGYCLVNLDKSRMRHLKQGENLLAIETSGGERGNFFDIALFNMKDDKAGNILFTPGQPNIVRGPNGFEWWLVYMANKNAEHRGQYINRVHFFDKTLFVEGITDASTAGYHPEPAKPTYGDTFDDAVDTRQNWIWKEASGWKVDNGELQAVGASPSYALVGKGKPACAYMFETGIRYMDEAGIIAWWKDAHNCMKIGFDKDRCSWYFLLLRDGVPQREYFALPAGFRGNVYHSIRIERDMDCLKVWLDGIPASGKSVFTGLPDEAGMPGIFVERGAAAFDGVIYTIGFDEYDEIPRWNVRQGQYVSGRQGMQTQSEYASAIKGEFLDSYEFDVQVNNLSGKGIAGIYPLYVDEQNYVKMGMDTWTRQLEVTLIKDGKIHQTKSLPLSRLRTLYADVKYTDFIEKGYRMKAPTWVDAIYLNRHEVDDEDVFVEDMFAKFDMEYLQDGEWRPVPVIHTGVAEHSLYNEASFEPVLAEGFRFINKEATDLKRHIYKIRINELFKDSYNIRAVRKSGKLYLFVDGKEILSLNVDYPESCIGLYSEGSHASYNGILYYHVAE